jgi:alpha/beta superfamily hydrolase
MTRTYHRSLFLSGPAGRLEASLWMPARDAEALCAVVCHPHPLYGGTLHNKVVFAAARALAGAGMPVLRFNFRGAGLSEGKHDSGRGEQDDVRAALDYLAGEYAGRPILLAGFSFGAWVGLRVGCGDDRVAELIGLGIPVNGSDLSYLLECTKPKLFLHGGRDPYGDIGKVRALVAQMPGPTRLVTVEGADHFFTGHLPRVGAAIREWIAERHPGQNG